MSNLSWCDLKNKSNPLKLHDCVQFYVGMSETNYFHPKQFQLKGLAVENTMNTNFKGSQKFWDSFPKPAVNTKPPVIGMAVGAKSKNPEACQGSTSFLKSVSGGKILLLTDMHGQGLRLRVMLF